MSTQLNEAINKLKASVTAELKAITDRLNKPDPDTAGALTALADLTAQLDAETAELNTPTPTV